MTKIKLFTLIFFTVALVSCAAFPVQTTSICDTLDGESLLCEMCEARGTTPELLGAKIVLVDYIGIRAGLYTREHAIDVLESALEVIGATISYSGFRSWVLAEVVDDPELVEISEMFPDSTSIMYTADRDMVKAWIEQHIANLRNIRMYSTMDLYQPDVM